VRGFAIVGDVRRHVVAGEPLIEERGEAARLVLVHEHCVARARAKRGDPLAQRPEALVPRYALEPSVTPRHRVAIAVRIVQTLQRCLAARA
jgi:hypothetical protein